MKLFLANSPSDYPNQFPPLGLLYLASAARNAGHEVAFYDLSASNANAKEFFSEAEAFAPAVFGISVYTTQIERSQALFKEIRERFPTAKIIVGGPHISALPGETIKDAPEVDMEIVGEGELTLCEILDFYAGKRESFKDIPGLCYRTDSGTALTATREQIKDLDSIAFPAFDLMKRFDYSYDKFAKGEKVGITVTSRGCPYDCTFCNKAVFGNRYRRRSQQNVIAELQLQKELLDIDEIYFVDDLFVTNQKWLDAFFVAYKASGLNLPWKCLGRVDQVEAPIYQKMKENGCFLIQFGVESGDDDMLVKIKKKITKKEVAAAVAAAQSAGLNVATYFILGHPGDTYKTVMSTINFATELNADICHFFVLVPFPGTWNYQFLPDELKREWTRIRYYHKGQYPISLCELAPEELFLLEKQARYAFYGRFGYLFKNVLAFKFPLKVTFLKAAAFAAFFTFRIGVMLQGRDVVGKIRRKATQSK